MKKIIRFRIVSLKRFVVFTIFLLVTLFYIGDNIYTYAKSVDFKNTYNENIEANLNKAEIDFINKHEVVSIFIESGDTAWNIQNKLTPNEDIRKVLYYTSRLNKKNLGYLKVGEKIHFLKTKE